MHMVKPDLRRHQRLLVPPGHIMRVHSRDSGPEFDGNATVIGLGGMFIRSAKTQPPGTVLQVRLEDPVASFDSECTVRHVAQNGMGVEITKISSENEQRLRFLLIQLKGGSGG
jgi:hypothetical protein